MHKIHSLNNHTDIFFPDNLNNCGITVIEIGHSFPAPGYASLKNKRNCYVIHYVLQGKGTFFDIPLEAPCGFLMSPTEYQYYTVDSDPSTPRWEQYWIMFSGDRASDFLNDIKIPLNPHIFETPYINEAWKIFQELQTSINYLNQDDGYFMLSGLFQLFSLHAVHNGKNNDKSNQYSQYVKNALGFIKEFYNTNICEDDIAEAVHISTKYLHKLFKQETGVSPIRYLNSYRIRCAKNLLVDHSLPINQIAKAVGFTDPNYFCRVFQRYNDEISPTQYKKMHKIK